MSDEDRLTVVNVVASTRVAEELNLPDIAIQLACEYEPEQFPGVVYRVVDPKLAILMFRSGRAVCTGGKNEDNIHTGIERMIADLRDAGIVTWDLSQAKAPVDAVSTEDLCGTYDNKDVIADEDFIAKVRAYRSEYDDKNRKAAKKSRSDYSSDWDSVDVGRKLRGGIGATISVGGKLTIDGVDLKKGMRVLVAGQDEAGENGIYEVTNASKGVLTRTEDADNYTPDHHDGVPRSYKHAIPSRKVMTAMNVEVTGGSNAGSKWILKQAKQVVVGVTPQIFVREEDAIKNGFSLPSGAANETQFIWLGGKSGDVNIEVQNMVATYALHYPEDYDGRDKWTDEPQAGQPRKLNLNHLTFHLPFDKVEYEPEQFPGLIYRLDYPKVVCLIFGSGKMVITGARHKDEILEAVEIIQDELADLL